MALTYGFTLRPQDTSADFSAALRSVTGDGITLQGGQFALTLNGFTATLSSGYALAAGRWLENDEPLALDIRPSGNNEDRVDALAVRVDLDARTAAVEILTDVDVDKLQAERENSIILYLIRVPRGATTLIPEYVTDLRSDPALCGTVLPLSAIAGDVLYVYQFLASGINQEVARVIALSQEVADKASQAISELDEAIQQAGGGPGIGELQTVRRPPAAAGWLLCDGGAVPAGYEALSALLDGTLPDISRPEDRYRTYIYGGTA